MNYAVSLSGLTGAVGQPHPQVNRMENEGMLPGTLAWWLFFDGELFLDERFQAWLTKMTGHDNVMRMHRIAKDPKDARPMLTWAQVQDLIKQPWSAGKVIQRFQRHNDLIEAPVGWVHQVVNIRPCVKFAFDCLIPKEVPDYAIVHARLVSPLSLMPPDYRAWSVAVEEAMAGINEMFGLQFVQGVLNERMSALKKRKN